MNRTIYQEYFLTETMTKNPSQTRKAEQCPRYKLSFLQQEGIKDLYQRRFNRYLKSIESTEEMVQSYLQITNVIHKTANEAKLGKT